MIYSRQKNKSDIEKVIVENGEIQIQNIKTMPDKMILKGSLFWRMAYLKDRQNCTLDHMEGELPFEEIVNMDGLTEEARIRVDCEMEDLRVTMIHSRKVSVRSVVNVKVHASVLDLTPDQFQHIGLITRERHFFPYTDCVLFPYSDSTDIKCPSLQT